MGRFDPDLGEMEQIKSRRKGNKECYMLQADGGEEERSGVREKGGRRAPKLRQGARMGMMRWMSKSDYGMRQCVFCYEIWKIWSVKRNGRRGDNANGWCVVWWRRVRLYVLYWYGSAADEMLSEDVNFLVFFRKRLTVRKCSVKRLILSYMTLVIYDTRFTFFTIKINAEVSSLNSD